MDIHTSSNVYVYGISYTFRSFQFMKKKAYAVYLQFHKCYFTFSLFLKNNMYFIK